MLRWKQVISVGMCYRIKHSFAGVGDFGVQFFYEVFHVLALGVVIDWAGVFKDGETCGKLFDFFFAYIYKWADECDVSSVEIRRRVKGVKTPFVTEAKQKRFNKVVAVVAECNFVTAFSHCGGVKHSAA